MMKMIPSFILKKDGAVTHLDHVKAAHWEYVGALGNGTG